MEILCKGCGVSKLANDDNFYVNGNKLRNTCKDCYKKSKRKGGNVGRPLGSQNKEKPDSNKEAILMKEIDMLKLQVVELYSMIDHMYIPKGQTSKVDRSIVSKITPKYKPDIKLTASSTNEEDGEVDDTEYEAK